MISKELLSEVLEVEIIHIFEFESNELIYNINPNEYTHTINIYELAHKCKEWCAKNRVYLLSGKTFDGYKCFNDDFSKHEGKPIITSYKSEPDAIFEATQWVYDRKDKEWKT